MISWKLRGFTGIGRVLGVPRLRSGAGAVNGPQARQKAAVKST